MNRGQGRTGSKQSLDKVSSGFLGNINEEPSALVSSSSSGMKTCRWKGVYKKDGRREYVAVADLGGSVLTGTLGNPLGQLGRQLSYTLHKASKVRQELSQDVSLGGELETLRGDFGVAMDTDEMILFNWHLANLEYANDGLTVFLSIFGPR
ncbi:hypothetical protein KY285_024213 [Solanum tuberosum]|nr:hypothetical protein KY289_024551 [Solanum tuberosum]KAH0676412.1 hypothetical protein KY285_024213 [Solanum tuberosum]